jgi:hypothetical protein
MRTPDSVIIGAQKAATTGLLRTLEQHPGVTVPPGRGPTDETTALHSGSSGWQKWVEKENPDVGRVAASQVLLVKLASAMYFADTLDSIHQLNPAVKLLVLLRHPVDRMVSQYLYAVQHGLEGRSADRALEEDVVERPGEYRLQTYSEGSRYSSSIDKIFRRFDERQVLFVESDSLRTGACIPAVERFLGIDEIAIETRRVNESRTPRSSALARATQSTALKTLGRRILPATMRRRARTAMQAWNASSAPAMKPLIQPALRERLLDRHASDVDAAERVLSKDLPQWRS